MEEKQQESRLLRILNGIERVGNKMPSPIMIFIYLSILVILASWVMSMFGVSVVNPVDNSEVAVNNLLTGEYFARMISEAGANFAGFPAFFLLNTLYHLFRENINDNLVKSTKRAVYFANSSWVSIPRFP
ncbi:AbgT family transporter [Aerococcus urinaeequi]|uniref:AbgT family transporter n=1 Tax=Aerococcus urinaeequi TaxID=51665 RepID=UPI00366E61C4